MKILGRTHADDRFSGAIVHLTNEELRILAHGTANGGFFVDPGATVDISQRAYALFKLEDAVKKANETPEQLRGMASALDAVVAAAVSAITPVSSEPPQS